MFGFHFDSSVDTSVLCIFYTHTTLLDVSTPPPPPTNTINPLHDSTPDPRFEFHSSLSLSFHLLCGEGKREKDERLERKRVAPSPCRSKIQAKHPRNGQKRERKSWRHMPVDRGETPLLETGSTCVRSRLGQLFKN